MSDVVFAFPGSEVDQVDAVIGDEPVDVGHEGFRDRVHQRRGHEREPAMALEEADHPQLVLQTGLIEVQVHPVDALDLQGHMIRKNVGNGAG